MKWHGTKNSKGPWVFTDNCSCSFWRLECGGQQHSEPFASEAMIFRELHIQASLSEVLYVALINAVTAIGKVLNTGGPNSTTPCD